MKRKIMFLTLLILMVISGGFGLYKSSISYLENRYVKDLKNYYTLIENNQKELNRYIMLTHNEDDLEYVFSLLSVYILIKNLYLSNEGLKNIEDIIKWQKSEMKLLNLSEYYETYKAVKVMENDIEEIADIVNRYKKREAN